MWHCFGEERMDVRQNQGVCGAFSSGKSEGADFVAQHTLLQVCYPVTAVLESCTTLIEW